MSNEESRREDLKDLSLAATFFGGGTALTGFFIDTLIYSERATPTLVMGVEVVGVGVAVSGAIGYVALNLASRRRD